MAWYRKRDDEVQIQDYRIPVSSITMSQISPEFYKLFTTPHGSLRKQIELPNEDPVAFGMICDSAHGSFIPQYHISLQTLANLANAIQRYEIPATSRVHQTAEFSFAYPRARPALSPEWRLDGDQIYTLAYVHLITYPRWIELQGIGGGTFPALDKAEIRICYSAHRVALSLRFASILYMWLRCLGLGLSSLVG
jgi:hypothetical protein